MSKFDNSRNLELTAAFTIGAESSNTITVGIQLLDRKNKNEIAERVALPFYLSSDANGDTPVAAATSLVAGTDGTMIETISNSVGMLISEADGDIDVVVGDASGVATYYLNLVMPDGKIVTSGAITFA
jgi:hypothetical protein